MGLGCCERHRHVVFGGAPACEDAIKPAEIFGRAAGLRPSSRPCENGLANQTVTNCNGLKREMCVEKMSKGVRYLPEIDRYYFERLDKSQGFYFNSPCEAFAALIDKVSGKGTWDRNPFVVVYEFEIVK